jgi:hypothetical protein
MVVLLPVKKIFLDSNMKIKSYTEIQSIEIEEEFKPFIYKGIDSGYKVSNLGNIINREGKRAPLYYDKDGYTRFSLYIPKNDPDFKNEKAIRYPYKTHRAVAELFVENPEPDINKLVLHKNDIRDCNIAVNLMWGTPQDNMDDKNNSGRGKYLKGEEKPDAIFTENDVREICDCIYNKGYRATKDILAELGHLNDDETFLKSYKNLISNIRKRHCWLYIIEEFEKMDD